MFKKIKIVLFISLCFLGTQGCIFATGSNSFLHYYADLKSEDFETEVRNVRNLTKLDCSDKLKAEYHLKLSVLLMHHNNPHPDYAEAQISLEEYMLLDEEGAKNPAVRNVYVMLSEIVRLKDVEQELTKKNKKWKTTIDKLKDLDVKIEQMRKQVK